MFDSTITRLLVGVATLTVLVFAYRRNRALLRMILADIAEARIDHALGGNAGPRPSGSTPQKPSGRRRRRHLQLVPSPAAARGTAAAWLRRHRGPGLVGPLVAAAVVSTAAYIGSTAEQPALAPIPGTSDALTPQQADETGGSRDLVQWEADASAPQPSPSSTKPTTTPPEKTPASASPTGEGAEHAPAAEPAPTEAARSPEPSPPAPSTTPPPDAAPAPNDEPAPCDELTLQDVLGECGLGLDLDGLLHGLSGQGR